MVVGHTDNRQIAKRDTREHYPDNWYLEHGPGLARGRVLAASGLARRPGGRGRLWPSRTDRQQHDSGQPAAQSPGRDLSFSAPKRRSSAGPKPPPASTADAAARQSPFRVMIAVCLPGRRNSRRSCQRYRPSFSGRRSNGRPSPIGPIIRRVSGSPGLEPTRFAGLFTTLFRGGYNRGSLSDDRDSRRWPPPLKPSSSNSPIRASLPPASSKTSSRPRPIPRLPKNSFRHSSKART